MARTKQAVSGYRTTKGERFSYWMYFLGENIFYGLIAINSSFSQQTALSYIYGAFLSGTFTVGCRSFLFRSAHRAHFTSAGLRNAAQPDTGRCFVGLPV